MRQIISIARLTVKAAFRFRLVVVLAVLLIAGVVLLPLMIKDLGTARSFTQIVLTYTLGLTTALLGFSTLWLACGSLAREIEEAQLQMVAVKPVGRWQIWLGKLFGIMALNGMLLLVAGGVIFGMMQWRAQRLSPEEQQVLQNEVFVARGSVSEPVPDYTKDVQETLRQRLQESPIAASDLEYVRRQILEQLKARAQIIRPNYMRVWELDFGGLRESLKNEPLFIRTQFNVAQENDLGVYDVMFEVGEPNVTPVLRRPARLAADTFHEIEIPANLISTNGVLYVKLMNLSETALLAPLEDGMEVLYREGGFALNFFRGLGIIFCWLTLLAAIGLCAASFLQFPVAAFFSLGILVVGLSSGTLRQAVEQGTVLSVNPETGMADQMAVVDYVALPAFKALLWTIDLVRGFSPIDSLSTGRSITWGSLFKALFQICGVIGGVFAAIGIVTLTKRELAMPH